MEYKEIVNKVRKDFGKADVSNYEDHLALQINITGEGEGAFYTEINNGVLSIEEYDYADNNASLTGDADVITKIFAGKLEISKAAEEGKLQITGDYDKAVSIQPVIDNTKKPKRASAKTAEKTAEKATVKKAAASKTAAAQTTAKAVEVTAPSKAKRGRKTAKKG